MKKKEEGYIGRRKNKGCSRRLRWMESKVINLIIR